MMKLSIKYFTILMFCFTNLNGQTTISNFEKSQIDTFINQTLKGLGIPGLACAIIKDDQVIYKNYLGKANLEYDIPISEESLFRLHSLSKVFVSVGIFQLIEMNEIQLRDPISKYLDDLPEKWQNITIAHLLAHSSGLPDMREETNPSEEIAMENVYGKEIQFNKGYRVSYNQTNFWLLNRIIRKIYKDGFSAYILKQFPKESNALFSNISDIIPNRVTEYIANENGELKNDRFYVADYMYGAGGLTLTLDDFIQWDKKLNMKQHVSSKSMKEMFKKYEYETEGGYAFTYGWFIQNMNNIQSYGFNGGGLVNYRTFPSKNLSIVWLTNGYTIPHNADDVTNKILGFIDEELKDKSEEVQKLIYVAFTDKSEKEAIHQYQLIKDKYASVNFENVLNAIGYAFLGEKKNLKAISIFELNTKEFANSANTYDSLAEAYFIDEQFSRSKQYYQKVVELDPENQNAKNMLFKIEQQIKE